MEIVEREAVHLAGRTVRAPLAELPRAVPPLWQHVFATDAGEASVFAELSDEPGGDVHVVTVGVLVGEPGAKTVTAPAGRWLHHEHRGPLTEIGRTYGEMFQYAASNGIELGTLKLDVGYRPDGQELKHDLYLLLADEESDGIPQSSDD